MILERLLTVAINMLAGIGLLHLATIMGLLGAIMPG